MGLFSFIRVAVCRLYGDDVSDLTPVEKWSLRASKLTTPDDIIGAAIIKSIAENFEDWTAYGQVVVSPNLHKRTWIENKSRVSTRGRWEFKGLTLINEKKDVTFKLGYEESSRDNDCIYPWFNIKVVSVNDTPIPPVIAQSIANKWKKLVDVKRKAETTAARAKADMERNEAAWNIAESLLGMKRNEFGALVPVKTVEEV